jgi:nitroreductase
MLPEIASNYDAFAHVVRTRRSVRAFLPDPIPDDVLDACFDLAALAPTSHNLEIWRFLDIRDREKLKKLRQLCFDQPPASQAPTLIVAVARPDLWRVGRRRMLERLAADSVSDLIDDHYRSMIPLLAKKYQWFVPLLFSDGPLHIFAPLKALIVSLVALFRPMMRGPFGGSEQAIWATKTTALACENFMLALRAAGYDSCALEGFDEPKVKRLLDLPHAARIAMVIAAGRWAKDGVIPQVRFERAYYVRRV